MSFQGWDIAKWFHWLMAILKYSQTWLKLKLNTCRAIKVCVWCFNFSNFLERIKVLVNDKMTVRCWDKVFKLSLLWSDQDHVMTGEKVKRKIPQLCYLSFKRLQIIIYDSKLIFFFQFKIKIWNIFYQLKLNYSLRTS